MQTVIRGPICLALLGLLTLPARAQEIALQPNLSVGFMQYEFRQEGIFSLEGTPIGTGLSEISFSDTLPFVSGGLTLFVDRAFVDVNLQKSFDGEDEDTLEQAGRGGNPVFTSNRINREWDREEYSFTFGYAVTDGLAVYAGYRASDTQFDEQNVLNVLNIQTTTFDSALDYEQDGPFLGANYGWRFGNSGVLAVNLGIAFIEGEITNKGPFPTEKAKGDTVGFTAGVSWTGALPISERLNYTISLDGYQYQFEADDRLTADFAESVLRLGVGLSYALELGCNCR